MFWDHVCILRRKCCAQRTENRSFWILDPCLPHEAHHPGSPLSSPWGADQYQSPILKPSPKTIILIVFLFCILVGFKLHKEAAEIYTKLLRKCLSEHFFRMLSSDGNVVFATKTIEIVEL